MSANGVILLNKHAGISSNQIDQKIKKILSLGKTKIGHIGTLDPLAKGILPVIIGNDSTKFINYVDDKIETYEFRVKFGYKSSTGDSEGYIKKQDLYLQITSKDIVKVIPEFIGKIQQKIPNYSAKKIDGKPLYFYARKGINIPTKRSKIIIYSLSLNNFSSTNQLAKFTVKCSKGTYIRSLGEEIAAKLNSFAYVTEIIRTNICHSSINQCCKIQDIEKRNFTFLPIHAFIALREIYLDKEKTKHIILGKKIKYTTYNFLCNEKLKIFDSKNNFVGIGVYKNKILKPSRLIKFIPNFP